MSISEILKSYEDSAGVFIDDMLLEKLEKYAELLKEWNEKINLTAIKDDEGIAVKHFIDCLSIFRFIEFKPEAKLIDVGTGAGFPGLVIAAARADLSVTLMDSTGKKLKAVSDIASRLGLQNCTVLHARAEEISRKPEYREKFDYATARAVAELNVLSEYCLPFVKCGGSFISMKGSAAEEETDKAKNAVSVLGGRIESVNSFDLCSSGERSIIEIKKVKQTPPGYPRASAKIQASPL